MRRKCKKVLGPICVLLLCLNVLLFTSCYILARNLPSTIVCTDDSEILLTGTMPVKAVRNGDTDTVGSDTVNAEYTATLRLFGIIPIKSVTVKRVSASRVCVLGTPFGMKIYADGVMVVGLADVDTAEGGECPAENAGIKTGDIILKVNGERVSTNGEIAQAVTKNGADEMTVELMRDGKNIKMYVTPKLSVSEKSYKLGLWVRDSSAGIGTLTFYDPATNVLAGLGHGITDSSTGELIPLASGELVGAEILSVTKSRSGSPGELHGRFTLTTLAPLQMNCERGVFGKADSSLSGDRVFEVAMRYQAEVGTAQLLTTVSGSEPEFFSCKIERIRHGGNTTQNMIIKITDSRLHGISGGIVQGMSGSPIIQNGKLIGALTHVFVNDPTRGYATFAEDMLETAQSVAEEKLKEAS